MSVHAPTIETPCEVEDLMETHGKAMAPRLRERRLQRGMTQQEVAEGLERLAWVQASRRVGVNADMVSKWERGQKSPSRFYLRLLCSLFDATADAAGVRAATAALEAATSAAERCACRARPRPGLRGAGRCRRARGTVAAQDARAVEGGLAQPPPGPPADGCRPGGRVAWMRSRPR